ncbi:hypothetical protein [Puerhibacterium puerhi]|uniref:hypothetical protein n=1 Tax=Puerhibacterium puerhi TaxID=2692623 RepID=UPI00135C1AFE|nr:hypothetical protein [Puerhibacterium puerhi]
MSDFIEWGALAQVAVAGLVVGAGIPALFALGLRLLTQPAAGAAGAADGAEGAAQPVRRSVPRVVGATLCLGVVVGVLALGLTFLVTGGH